MCLSRLVFSAGCGIRLYRFLIIAFLSTDPESPKAISAVDLTGMSKCSFCCARTHVFALRRLLPVNFAYHVGHVKRFWYLSPMRAAKVQASLRIRAVTPEPPLLAHTGSESRGTFRQKVRSLAPLNGWACAVKICHDGMLEDTNSLDGAHIIVSCLVVLEIIMFQ